MICLKLNWLSDDDLDELLRQEHESRIQKSGCGN